MKMKRRGYVLAALTVLLILLLLAGCSKRAMLDRLKEAQREIASGMSESSVSQSDEEKKPETIDVLMEALDKRDRDLFKSLFSKTTLSLADDLDKGLDL